MGEMAAAEEQNRNGLRLGWFWLVGLPNKIANAIVDAAKEAKKMGEEDPRRVVHSLKVGFAITVVSLFYYFDTLYEGFGVCAMWAVMTVVVIFEFSVGATLGKGVNRGIATFSGGALGVGAHRLASFSGEDVEPVLIGLSVFLIAAVATFLRFFPKLRARYDYGLMIFILTFCLICVSSYREDEVLDVAHKRLSTIMIGVSATIFICAFICPVWAGEDLHNLIASNVEKLAISLEGFGQEYFKTSYDKKLEQKSCDEYSTILSSKSTEDSLANFAKWEPRHGKFRYRHPWDQYLKIGSLTRKCAYKIDALNIYLSSDMKTPSEVQAQIQDSCAKMIKGCSCALTELALSIELMTSSPPADPHISAAKTAATNLKSLLKTSTWPSASILDTIPAAAVASLLMEIVSATVEITGAVHELASLAGYKSLDETHKTCQTGKVNISRTTSIEGSHNFRIVIE